MCVHDWQPISGWPARYRCCICRVLGCKFRLVTGHRARSMEIEPHRCEAVRGGKRCSEPAVFARRGRHFRCAAHQVPGHAVRARHDVASGLRDSRSATAAHRPPGTIARSGDRSD